MTRIAVVLLALAACTPASPQVPVAAPAGPHPARLATAPAPRPVPAQPGACKAACAHYHDLGCAEGDHADCPMLLAEDPDVCGYVASAADVRSLCDVGLACTQPSPAETLASDHTVWRSACH